MSTRFAVRSAMITTFSTLTIAAVLSVPLLAQHATDAAGPEHQALAKRAGTYEVTSKMAGPGAPAGEASKGTATLKTVCDGKFLMEENSGAMMGEKYTGLRLLGYNNDQKAYEATWIYSMSTAFLQMKGKSDDGGKTIKVSGDVTEGGMKMTLRAEYHFTSDDSFVVKLIAGDAGAEMTVLEETYTRKK